MIVQDVLRGISRLVIVIFSNWNAIIVLVVDFARLRVTHNDCGWKPIDIELEAVSVANRVFEAFILIVREGSRASQLLINVQSRFVIHKSLVQICVIHRHAFNIGGVWEHTDNFIFETTITCRYAVVQLVKILCQRQLR